MPAKHHRYIVFRLDLLSAAQVTEQVATHPPNPGLTQYCGKHDVLLHRTTGVMFQETRKSVMPEWEDGDYVRSVCVCVYMVKVCTVFIEK